MLIALAIAIGFFAGWYGNRDVNENKKPTWHLADLMRKSNRTVQRVYDGQVNERHVVVVFAKEENKTANVLEGYLDAARHWGQRHIGE